VSPEIVANLKTYREAVRWAWLRRRRVNMTQRILCEEVGSYPPHVSDYLNADDALKRRDLPASKVAAFETAVGNTAVSQWLALQSELPVVFIEQERKVA
jgi:hypothetical protein